MKPIFILYLSVVGLTTSPNLQTYFFDLKQSIENMLGDEYSIIVLSIYNDVKTHAQIFYPNGSEQICIDDIMKIMSEKVCLKNVRVKFNP